MNGLPRVRADASADQINELWEGGPTLPDLETYTVYGTDKLGRLRAVVKTRTKAEGDAHRAQLHAEHQRRIDEQSRHARNVARENAERGRR